LIGGALLGDHPFINMLNKDMNMQDILVNHGKELAIEVLGFQISCLQINQHILDGIS